MNQAPDSGSSLHGVRLGKLLGQGGASMVYAATDERGRPLAVKVLRQTQKDDPEAHQRLMREARILGALSHPGLIRVHDAGVAPSGHPYLVMERVSDRTLAHRLEADGPLGPGEAWRLVRAVASALEVVHRAGVLHRDLKPGNILLDGDRVRISDFGLALDHAEPRVTRDGATTGTPAYMAPEQWWGAEVDLRTDIYGLGAVLYQCLSGKPPWHGDPGQMLHQVATSAPPALASLGIEVPAAVEAFVQACLCREADGRPADLAAFLRDGDAAFGHREPRRALEPALLCGGLLGGALVVGYGGSHSPAQWIYEAGHGGYVLPLLALVGALLMRTGWGRLVGPFLPLTLGAVTTATAFGATLAGVGRATPEERFVVFHMGLAESNSALFMGAMLSAVLAAWLALQQPRQERPGWPQLALCAVALGTAVLAWDGVALMAGVTASVLLLRRVPGRSAAYLAASLGTLLALCAAAWARHSGDAARLWAAELTRAERASAVTTASLQGTSLLGALLCVVLALVVAGCWRAVPSVPRRRLALAALMVALTAAALGLPWWYMHGQRRLLWNELAPRFSLWRELDPPRGHGSITARVGLTLQLGRRSVAVDGQTVAPTRALLGQGRTGPLLVAGRLGRKLQLDRTPQLVLTADRSLPWPHVARALAAAHDLGVRRLDLIFLPGPAFALSPAAPPEASFVLPSDLRALEVQLVRRPGGGAVQPQAWESFGQVAARLARRKRPVVAVGE